MAGIKRWIPSLIVMIVIFITSSITGPTIEKAGLGNETYHINGHFIMFMILCTTYYKALRNVFNSVVLTSFYGIFDEFHQVFTVYRSSGIFDIAVDILGGVITGIILWKYSRILPKKLKNWLEN